MTRPFTKKEYRAMRAALAHALAGAIETDDDDALEPTRKDYETALRKVHQRLAS